MFFIEGLQKARIHPVLLGVLLASDKFLIRSARRPIVRVLNLRSR